MKVFGNLHGIFFEITFLDIFDSICDKIDGEKHIMDLGLDFYISINDLFIAIAVCVDARKLKNIDFL